jgi:hypothetical protein
MNTEFITPGVPSLSDEWIALRTEHLVEEVTRPSPNRRRRFVLTGVGGGVAATAAVLVGLLGPWATPAFAGWTSQPTSASSSQLSAADSACTSLAANLASVSGATTAATLQPMSLSDVRGPYTLIVYGTSNPSLCVSGTDLTSLHENGGSISIGSSALRSTSQHTSSWAYSTNQSTNGSAPSPGGAVANLTYTDRQGDEQFTVAEGSVGSEVSGATLLLSDGTSVVTTVSNGLFAAWWPGQATMSSIQVTTTNGVD